MRLTHTGHHVLSDYSVLRLDLECGHHVASWYTAESVLKAYACGSLEAMADVVSAWATAFEASFTSPAVVLGDTAAVGDMPDGGQLLKETA